MIKDEKGGKIMIKFVALRAKMYAHKMTDKTLDDNSSKSTKEVCSHRIPYV